MANKSVNKKGYEVLGNTIFGAAYKTENTFIICFPSCGKYCLFGFDLNHKMIMANHFTEKSDCIKYLRGALSEKTNHVPMWVRS